MHHPLFRKWHGAVINFLLTNRGAVPRPDDFVAKLDFPQHQLMTPEAIQPPTLSPQVGVQLGRNKALLTQSYNSPMGLYSSQNIADTLVNSMKKYSLCFFKAYLFF
jgi:hypothetical protein